MKKSIIFILVVTLIFNLSACTKKENISTYFDIPEALEIQKLLDSMSEAILNKDLSGYSQAVSLSCPQRDARIRKLKDMTAANIVYKKYSQKISAVKRVGDAILCTVEIDASSSAKNEQKNYSDKLEYLFSQENGQWKLSDFNFHYFINPSIVVGSSSTLYDAARDFADSLSAKLYTDMNHLQAYGDIIMVGSPYDNASILDLEARGLTDVIVTQEYPNNEKGIVQVLPGVDTYRHVILIQGSTSDTAIESIRFMQSYLKEKPFLNSGVYVIYNNKLEPANPLEISTLATLDYNKTRDRMFEVQKNIEANIFQLEDELENERAQLQQQQKNAANPFPDYDSINYAAYIDAFSKDKNYLSLIPMYLADQDLCSIAFKLPPGGNAGAVYAFTDYINESAKNLDTEYSTSLLRLTGFSEKQIFSSINGDGKLNFFNIDGGYLANPASIESCNVKTNYSIDKVNCLENDCFYIDYEDFKSNANKEDIILYAGMLNTLYDSKKDINQSRVNRTNFEEADNIKYNELLYNVDYVFDLLRENTIFDDVKPLYSSLSEAKSQLVNIMGELLSVKCSQFLYSSASKFPGSQYDYSRYSAGFINIEYPNVYSQAACKGKATQKIAQDIKSRSLTDESRIDGILSILKTIDDNTWSAERFTYPDSCLAKKSGTVKDKALISYVIYENIFGEDAEAYIALGTKSSYLVFKTQDVWNYIDCKDNELTKEINDEINIVFNNNDVYNAYLEIGEKPDF